MSGTNLPPCCFSSDPPHPQSVKSKTIDENLISVIPEDSEDLLNLRRIIRENDKVIGDTTRVLKQDKEYARPDKGERIKIRIALTVEKISLDEVLDKLGTNRIKGEFVLIISKEGYKID